MRLTISHTTTYRYSEPVTSALQQVRLVPVSGAGQNVLRWDTALLGGVVEFSYRDQHTNHVDFVSVSSGATELVITSEGQVETTDLGGVVTGHEGFTPLWLFLRSTRLTTAGPGISDLVTGFSSDASPAVGQLHELAAEIGRVVDYRIGATTAMVTAEEALSAGAGVCQDHAHIFISAVRQLGTPARYVSGYLMIDDRVDQEATHAWAEAWVEGLGWVGFDVSNGISPDDRYVRVAVGLDYRDAAPVRGVRTGSGVEQLSVSVQVQQ